MMNFEPQYFIDSCVKWIQDWFEKNGKGCNAIIGMSGGKDSTVAAALCAKALGPERVYGFSMPGKNQGTNNADDICAFLGINYENIPIKFINNDFLIALDVKANLGDKISEQTKQNLPPRIRMTMLYALAQSLNGRVVGTCNKSELYVGYATRYGDMASDFEPLGNLTCRQVVAVGKALGIPDEWVERVPDDGLPGSEPDDEKFKKWGFSYKELDEYLESEGDMDRGINWAIHSRHTNQLFKMKLGEIFYYTPSTDKALLKETIDEAFENNKVNKDEANVLVIESCRGDEYYNQFDVDVEELLSDDGPYWYWTRWNPNIHPIMDRDYAGHNNLLDYIRRNSLCCEEQFDSDEVNECWYGVIGITKDYKIVKFTIRDDGMIGGDGDWEVISEIS